VAGALLPSVPDSIKGALHMALAGTLGLQRCAALTDAVHEAGVLLAGTIFLLTPTPIAAVGLLLVALGGPMIRTIDALAAVDEAPRRSPRRRAAADGDSGTETEAGGVVALLRAQLRYWISYAALCGAVRVLQPALLWLPFMTHCQLLAVLWLQLPIFRALTRLLSQLVPPLLRLRSATNRDDVARAPRANALYSARLSQSPARTNGAGASVPAPPPAAAAPAEGDDRDATNGTGVTQ
jgi:hypothetical protein